MDYAALATTQQDDEEVRKYLRQESGLQLRKIEIPGIGTTIYYDTVKTTPRSFLTEPFRRAAFNIVHNLAHLGIRSTVKLVAQHYVWPSMNADCRD